MNMSGRWIAAASAALLALSTAPSAGAAEVLDQSALVRDIATGEARVALTAGTRAPTISNAVVGQSVTAGVSGLLTRIEVQAFHNTMPISEGGVLLSVFDGIANAGGTLVGAQFRPFGMMPPSGGLIFSGLVTSFDVSEFGYRTTAGQKFSFVFSVGAIPDSQVLFLIGNAIPGSSPTFDYNVYAGGDALYSNNGAPLRAIGRDIGFQTFVDPDVNGAVPEPGTWALMLVGFGLAGAMLRRRQQAVPAAA